MIGALWTGIAGLSSQQQALDNESNNIANVNTVGYKASRISFADQVYQDRIGKGSKVLDAEKLYTQGGTKPTGVAYDMALKGEGFFTVAKTSSSGITENFYTRAGNFRMGDNGTLQDAAGNEVQGWTMSPISTDTDVSSTNPNVNVFTNDYTKTLSSKVVKHTNYVETITAKATDYKSTATSDSSTVFSGAGMKTASAKISDIEAATKSYDSWLQKLKDNPDGASSTSGAQSSQINFKSGTDSLLIKDGVQISVTVAGIKKDQDYIKTTASSGDYAALHAANSSLDVAKRFTFSATALTAPTDADKLEFDKMASQIATYKALADKISEIQGIKAYMVEEPATGTNDVLELSDTYSLSTDYADMIKGIIEIKGLIPGEEFTVTDVNEVSSGTKNPGNVLTGTVAIIGSGTGALESAGEALSELISGKQRDVYTSSDLSLTSSSVFLYSVNIYDKELKQNIPVPNNGAIPLSAVPIFINSTGVNGVGDVDTFVSSFNAGLDAQGNVLSPKLTDYLEAQNINGNLVIQTLSDNYDVEYAGDLKQLSSYNLKLNEIVDNSSYTFNLNVNNISYPITVNFPQDDLSTHPSAGSLDDFIRTEIQTQVNAINTANPTYQLQMTPNVNGAFSIYTANEDINFVGSNLAISDSLPSVGAINIQALGTPDITYEKDKITITEPLSNIVYSIDIMGQTISYDNTLGTAINASDITSSFNTQISANPILSPLVTSTTDSDTIGNPSDGVVLTNGLNNLQGYGSVASGKFMIELPSGTTDLALFLYDRGANDTIQVFTKDGEHIAGTIASDLGLDGSPSWTSGFKPEDIIALNSSKFNVGASYIDNHTLYTLNSPRESSGVATVPYIDKDGNPQTKGLGPLNEMVVIPNLTEDLVVFINGSGSYDVSAEWGISGGSTAGSSSLILEQKALQNPIIPTGLGITNLNGITNEDINTFNYTGRNEHRFEITTDDTKSSSVYTLSIEGKSFEIKTDQTPTRAEIINAFNVELVKDFDWNQKFEIQLIGNDLVVRDKDGEYGYTGFMENSTLSIKSLTEASDIYETATSSISNISKLDKNTNFSGREGAGAEFIEIRNKVDQTTSQGSLQLKLDVLGISESSFGEFNVDDTGLITIKQDGAEFAVGQVAIALFNSNRGLNPIGDNLVEKTNESGEPIYNLNNDKTATVESKTLELSTADLSESLVNLMVFQRAFEANAKSITTADTLLNTLINLKR